MAIGFTSLFGAMFSKTYRVYVVFRDYQLKSKVRKQIPKLLLRIQVHFSMVKSKPYVTDSALVCKSIQMNGWMDE